MSLFPAAGRSCRRSWLQIACRAHSTSTGNEASAIYFNRDRALDPSVTETPNDLTQEQQKVLHASLRVDQAGELAADYIYRGQLAVLGRDPKTGPVIQVCRSALCEGWEY
jgi:ubiquinone biosynthesis monooxygenase Coq7